MNSMELIQATILVCFALITVAGGETRYECMSGGGDDMFGMGESEFGDAEFGEFDPTDREVGEDDGFMGGGLAGGSLTCPLGNRASILVKRVAYGVSMFGSRCETAGYCKEEFDTGHVIAERCDGRSSCFIDFLPPVFLKCGSRSTYTLVEYECIDEWATFGVCESVSTVVRGPSIFITSPGYLSSLGPSTRRGTQMCDCIVQSEDRSSVYLDYLQTQLASDKGQCRYEYVTIESKRDINQTTIDKELEVCGRRHVGGRWFEGSIRVTYASGGPMQRKGLIAKFTADNRGHAPRLEVECGAVDSTNLKLAERPASQRTPPSPYSPADPLGLGLPTLNMRSDFERALRIGALTGDDGLMDGGLLAPFATFPPSLGSGLTFLGGSSSVGIGGGGRPGSARAEPAATSADRPPTTWKINLPKTPKKPPPPTPPTKQLSNQFKTNTRPAAPTTVTRTRTAAAPALKPVNKNRPVSFRKPAVARGVNVRGQIPARRPQTGNERRAGVGGTKKSNKIVDEPGVVNTPVSKPDTTGSFVGVVFGGIGGLLILASFGILVVNKLRKRQRRNARKAEYNSSNGSASITYGKGWETGQESVYATVGEVSSVHSECANPAADSNCQETTFINEAQVQKILNATKCQQNADVQRSVTTKVPDYHEGELGADRNGQDRVPEVAVIEVHQSFDGDGNADVKHTTDCLPDCGYSTVAKARGDDRPGTCATCNIARPPRRKDTRHGYDNNIGIKKTHHDG